MTACVNCGIDVPGNLGIWAHWSTADMEYTCPPLDLTPKPPPAPIRSQAQGALYRSMNAQNFLKHHLVDASVEKLDETLDDLEGDLAIIAKYLEAPT